ncbi:hypothetical protein V2I22_04780 [Campylobacter sp. CLAX-7218-21]|uniref:hypothetical protein n=1 Tax=Campylobacter devanensis TaxID=3161138 RepID=UPI002EBE6D25|nr:hypothetical protein [Campylobacter sp. CLAX-7218-21]
MNALNSSFARLDQIAPFMHISAAALFIALQITVVVCGHYCFKDIEQNPHRYKLILKEFNKFLFSALAIVAFLGFGGMFMSYGERFPIGDPMVEAIVKTKLAILAFIGANLAYIWYKFRQAKEAFLKDDMLMSHENLVLIIYYFTPLNIVLSFINIYLGVTFRGFL